MASWISDYAREIDSVSESPTQFNLWAGMSVLGSVLKKNVYIKFRTFTVYPNQYIILVSPPGIGKGEAIHPAHDLTKPNQLVNYISDRVTAPRILEKLYHGFTAVPIVKNGTVHAAQKDSSATLMSTELRTLLTSSEWMLDFLCDAWDRGSFDYDTKNKGSFTVSNMCVSLMGACVPDYIRKLNKDSNAAISSGFSARTLFINATMKSKVLPWNNNPAANPIYLTNMKTLSDRLQVISQLKGEFVLDPKAEKLWDSYYNTLNLNISPDDTDVYRNFKARQHIHVLKAAMILTCALEPTALVITDSILNTSIKMIDSVAEGVDDIFRGVGESDLSAGIARLQLYFERKGQVTYNQLVSENMRHLNIDDIVKICSVLETIGFIKISNHNGTSFKYEYTGMPINPRKKP